MTGKEDRANTHTHPRTQAVCAMGQGGGGVTAGRAYTFNVQVKCEAYAPRNVRVSASVYQCVSVYHCISVSPATLYMYVCVCWYVFGMLLLPLPLLPWNVATFSFVLRARGGCRLR